MYNINWNSTDAQAYENIIFLSSNLYNLNCEHHLWYSSSGRGHTKTV